MQQWRPTGVVRLFAAIAIVTAFVLGGLTCAAGIRSEDVGVAAIGIFLFPTMAGGLWLLAFRTSITADSSGVVVRNPLATRALEYSDIVHCEPGYWGIAIMTKAGPGVIAVAVQKSRFAQWTHLHTRSDDVADFINQRAAGA